MPSLLARTAWACGSHTFYQKASACSTSYSMAVEGSFSLRRLSDAAAVVVMDIAVHGMLEEYGPIWLETADDGVLRFEFSEPSEVTLSGVDLSGLGDEGLDVMYGDPARF